MEITNDPDGKIARENAERRAQEKKAAEEKAEKRAGKKQYQSLLSSDTAVISEEGRKALQNKMSAFAKTGTATEVRRLSSVSSFGYCNF